MGPQEERLRQGEAAQPDPNLPPAGASYAASPVAPVTPVAPVVPVDRPVAVERRVYDPRLERAVWFIVGVVCVLIAVRFFMKLLGASYQADFVRFIYGITGALIAPFRGIFQTAGTGTYILEPESLIAIAIYALIGWGIVALIRILRAPKHRIDPLP